MSVTLAVQPKTEDKKGKTAEQISAVIYGPKFASTAVLVDKKDFEKTFKTAGESTIIELQGLESPVEVLVKEVAFSPVKGGVIHVDFYALEMGKEITTHVPLHFINESPAEKLGAVINKVLHEVEIICKPKDLPSHIDVDLTKLANFEDKIQVADLAIPKGVKIETDPEDIIAIASAVEEEPEVVEEPIPAADVPVEKKGGTDAEEEPKAE